jgi:hypothetical protein
VLTFTTEAIQGKAARRILGVFRTAPALPAALEAGFPPRPVRLERLSVLYGLRVKDLSGTHPVSKAIEETTFPRETVTGWSLAALKLMILLIPDSLCWMAANSESFVTGSATSHLTIQWCDYSLLVTTTKRSRGYIDSPFRQVVR